MTRPYRIAIVRSEFNPEVTLGLREGAAQVLLEHGISKFDEFSAPGAFEIPLIAKRLAKTGLYDGVVCLGCVIKGDTAHFEFISLGTAIGLQMAALETEVPLSFGILTTYDDAQAQARSKLDEHNKGREAALAVLGTLNAFKRISIPGSV